MRNALGLALFASLGTTHASTAPDSAAGPFQVPARQHHAHGHGSDDEQEKAECDEKREHDPSMG